MPETQSITYCLGCGEGVPLPAAGVSPTITRETAPGRACGRVTIANSGELIHQCADGEYVLPDQVAAPQKLYA